MHKRTMFMIACLLIVVAGSFFLLMRTRDTAVVPGASGNEAIPAFDMQKKNAVGASGPTAKLILVDKIAVTSKTMTIPLGETVEYGDLMIRIVACSRTPVTVVPDIAAFVQVSEQRLPTVERIFSGWMFRKASSVNPLEHARYDILVKDCSITSPDTGPDAVTYSGKAWDSSPVKKSFDAAPLVARASVPPADSVELSMVAGPAAPSSFPLNVEARPSFPVSKAVSEPVREGGGQPLQLLVR